MNFQELVPSSFRKSADHAAEFILSHPEKFPLLFEGVTDHGQVIALRISRVISLVYAQNKEIVNPHIKTIYNILLTTKYGSVVRNFLMILQYAHPLLDEEEISNLLGFCFDQIENHKAEIAHEVLALATLYEISKIYPELKPELRSIIDLRYEDASPAFKARSRSVIKLLNREIAE